MNIIIMIIIINILVVIIIIVIIIVSILVHDCIMKLLPSKFSLGSYLFFS